MYIKTLILLLLAVVPFFMSDELISVANFIFLKNHKRIYAISMDKKITLEKTLFNNIQQTNTNDSFENVLDYDAIKDAFFTVRNNSVGVVVVIKRNFGYQPLFYGIYDKLYLEDLPMIKEKDVFLNNGAIITIFDVDGVYINYGNNDMKRLFEINHTASVLYHSQDSLLISGSNFFKCLRLKSNQELYIDDIPEGFLDSLLCTCLYDTDSIVLCFKNKIVVYKDVYNFNYIDVKFKAIKVEVADLDPFEKAIVCLSDDSSLYIIRVYCKSINKISENISDFTIVHVPNDVIVVLRDSDVPEILNIESKKLNDSLDDIINALDNQYKIKIGVSADNRSKIAFRKDLVNGNFDTVPDLKLVVGSYPKLRENVPTLEKKYSISNINIDQSYISFNLDSSTEMNDDINIFVTCKNTNCESFVKYNTINKFSIGIGVYLKAAKGFGPLFIFVMNNNETEYVGKIDVPLNYFLNKCQFPRIDKCIKVVCECHFDISKTSSKIPGFKIEPIDNGFYIWIQAENYNEFQQKVELVKKFIPDKSTFTYIKDKSLISNMCNRIHETLRQTTIRTKQDLIDINSKILEFLSLI